MPGLSTLYVVALLANVPLALVIAFFAVRRRRTAGALSFLAWELSAGLWSASSAISALCATEVFARFWAVQVRMLGVSLICVFALVFSMEYTGRRQWVRPRRL